MSEKIAFIGVGNMGNPMAVNLLKAGSKIKVFDVSKQMLEKAREKNNLSNVCFKKLNWLNIKKTNYIEI